MVNKNTAVRTDGFWRVCRAGWRPVWHGWKWGWNAGGVGQQITFRSDAWRDECHGVVSIIGHGRCPCEGGQPRSILRAHPRCWTDAAACAPSRPSGCPGCMLRCWQSPTDMLPFVVGANVEKAPWGAFDLTVDPHPLRTVDTPARDHGIGRPMRGSRLSATKPGGEQQASLRASGRRTSTTLAFGHWVFKFENQLQVRQRTENLDPQNFGRKQQDKKRSVSQSDLVMGVSTRDFFLARYKYF